MPPLIAPLFAGILMMTSPKSTTPDPMAFDPAQNVQPYDDGKLWVGVAIRDQKIEGIPVPMGAMVEFGEDGRLKSLVFHAPQQVCGVRFAPLYGLEFEKGALISGVLAEDTTLDGLPLTGGKPVTFHPGRSLKLKSGELASTQTRNGFTMAAHSEVTLFRSGYLESATSDQSQTIHGVEVAKGEQVNFHPNGFVESIYNDWGMGRWDNKGHHLGHKEFARREGTNKTHE